MILEGPVFQRDMTISRLSLSEAAGFFVCTLRGDHEDSRLVIKIYSTHAG